MSAGGCSYKDVDTCSRVKVWDLPAKYFEVRSSSPVLNFTAYIDFFCVKIVQPARYAMQQREARVPYYYTLVRHAFETGLSPLFPMYYNFPQFENAYATNAKVRSSSVAFRALCTILITCSIN